MVRLAAGPITFIPQVCCWTVVCWLPTLDLLGLKVMHSDALNAVCTAASTPSLRILRALNLLKVPQKPAEIAEGLELCPSVVSRELRRLETAGIVTTVDEQIHLAVDLNSFFGEPLTCPPQQSLPLQRKGARA